MRWDDFRRSDNVEDAREGGGGFHVPGGAGGLGIGTIIVLGLIGYALGIDPRLLIGGAELISGGGGPRIERQGPPPRTGAPSDHMGQFVAAVLGQTEDRWKEVFAESGQQYRPPKLRLYVDSEPSACGLGQAAMGPFYCPGDQRIYLDLSFFRQLERRFRSCTSKSCEFAATYVITHEVGHHVQNLLRILPEVRRKQQTAGSKAAANQLQVRVELQADCFAGLWANREEAWRKRTGKPSFLDPGDIDVALRTAQAIGDDTLQRSAGRQVVPDSFTHGSAEQRKRWFMTGFTQGRVSACNTFSAARL